MATQPSVVLRGMASTIIVNVSGIISFTFSHGVFMLLFSVTVASFLQRGLRTRSQRGMLLLAVISFTGATVGCAAFITNGILQIQSAMVDNLEVPLDERLVLSNDKTYQLGLVTQWSINILPSLSDSVVVWRAWVVFFDNRRVIIGPLLLLLGTIATTLVSLVLYTNVDTYIATAHSAVTLGNNFYNASLAFSLATNAVATLMVGYNLWVHRTHLTQVLGRAQRITRAQNVLIILIESGMFYLALQVAIVVLALYPPPQGLDGPRYFVAQVLQDIYPEISGMYPMIVIALVNNQRSFVDTYGLTSLNLNSGRIEADNTTARPATAGHLVFAPPAETTTESLENRNAATGINMNAELGVTEKGVENVAAAVEKRQAQTAAF